jgi:hypothetical protein
VAQSLYGKKLTEYVTSIKAKNKTIRNFISIICCLALKQHRVYQNKSLIINSSKLSLLLFFYYISAYLDLPPHLHTSLSADIVWTISYYKIYLHCFFNYATVLFDITLSLYNNQNGHIKVSKT